MSFKGSISMRWIIAVTLGVVFFTSLITTIATQTVGATNNANITGAASTVLGLTTLVVVIVFIAKLAGKA
jgi:hypothetical protein